MGSPIVDWKAIWELVEEVRGGAEPELRHTIAGRPCRPRGHRRALSAQANPGPDRAGDDAGLPALAADEPGEAGLARWPDGRGGRPLPAGDGRRDLRHERHRRELR